MKVSIRRLTEVYLIIYAIIICIYCSINMPSPTGEWDDYSLPVASLINERDFSISESDVSAYKEIFPDWASYIDNYALSGYTTRDGGQMSWYFPTYSMACIPFVFILQTLKLPTIYAFVYTNITILLISLFIVLYKLRIGEKRKLLVIFLLSINPIVFYLGWTSAEAFIYSFLVMGLVFWYNRAYKRAAFFVSIAGMLNPTIMSIGIIMILEYFANLLKQMGKDDTFVSFCRHNLLNIFMYGACYIVGVIPFAYNYYNVGHINLTAASGNFTVGRESTISRFLSYLFDLNYGILPYFCVIFIMSLFLLIVACLKKHWRYLQWMFTFFLNVVLYSIMVHINSGMSGIARYNSWGTVVMIFAVCLYFDELIQCKKLKVFATVMLSISTFLTGLIVYQYGPYLASRTSYVYMTPVAAYILDKRPCLYNPLHSTFNSRTTHIDGGYMYETPIIYSTENGYVRKILAKKEDIYELSENYTALSGENEWFLKQLNKLDEKESYISIPSKYKILKCSRYELGSTIWFNDDDFNANHYVSIGLSEPESWGTWTSGHELQMSLRTSSKATTLHGFIDCGVFNGQQTVQIYVNDQIVNNMVYRGGGIEFDFDNSEEHGFINIRIELPDANSPFMLGQSDDNRILGLGLQKMVITD